MLLALQPPTTMQHDIKPPPHLNHIHEYSTSAQSHYKSSLNSSLSRYSPPDSPRHLPSLTNGVTTAADSAMSGSSGHGHSYSQHPPPSSLHHRGLPPPTGSGFALPPPTPTSQEPLHRSSSAAPSQPHAVQHQSQSGNSITLGQLPAPPTTWSATVAPSDEAMRSWLHAKAEEDRRRQEEERTTQEKVRLEQRRLERDMLRESLDRGIPPAMVPLIFAGLGSQGNSAGVSQAIEFAQNYMQGLTLQQQQQQQQQPPLSTEQQQRIAYEQQLRHQSLSSPDLRREREREQQQQAGRDRMIPPNPYAAQQQSQALASHSQRSSSFSAGAPPSMGGALSKLNTVDFAPPQSSTSAARQGLHPSLSASNLTGTFAREAEPSQQQNTSATAQSGGSGGGGGSGIGLFFHHWTPPTGTGAAAGSGQGSGQQPPTPSGKSMQGSPYGSQGSSAGTGTHGHLRKQQGPPQSQFQAQSQSQSQAQTPSAAGAAAAVAGGNVEWAENSPKKRKMTHHITSGAASGGSGSSGGSATRQHASAMSTSVQTAGVSSATGGAIASTPSSLLGPASSAAAQGMGEEAIESESTGSAGRDVEREREREPLRPSSRQQRIEERQPGGGAYGGYGQRGYDDRERERERG